MWARVAISAYGLLGAAAVAAGLYLWWPPAAPMFAGAFMIFDAWRLSGNVGKRDSDAEPSDRAASE